MSSTLETMRDRGAGLNVVWREFVVLFGIGVGLPLRARALPRHDRHDGLRLA